MFETDQMESSLLIELWNKGILWDTNLGGILLPLATIRRSSEEGSGNWLALDKEVFTEGDHVKTTGVSGHSVLLDTRFEMPMEIPEAEARLFSDSESTWNGDAFDEQRRRNSQPTSDSADSEKLSSTSSVNEPAEVRLSTVEPDYSEEHLVISQQQSDKEAGTPWSFTLALANQNT
ncbi:protein unc-13 homolog A-like [Watersipora subatra]|uniref:protein unc-13 homolog A-like n=1 Tax=Watersipora subatra TaxID=2589382 RepID=UPI00355C1318